MKLYSVFKTGVYRHECAGVFSTLDMAEAAAQRCIAGERDDYHTYVVVEFELDTQTPQEPLASETMPGSRYNYRRGGESM